ncbi:uncharacterized protein LOC142236478 isoform X2 [Haematobia irritans]|uniref:uncharacterized protein LOC142236478 isoform X2 n=1 Tax=Haematobia irritans TaxID=7368 RepID=UPI003F4FAC70
MFYKNRNSLIPHRKRRFYKSSQLSSLQRRILSLFKTSINVFLVLIMSIVIVKASALTLHQNRTSAKTAFSRQLQPRLSSHFQATTSEFITTKPKTLLPYTTKQQKENNYTVTNHIIRTNIIVGGSADIEEPQEKMRAKIQQLLQREKDDNEEKKQLQQEIQQQQQQEQQQQILHGQEERSQQHNFQDHLNQQKHDLLPQPQHAMLAGENAYLLERIDDNGASVGGRNEQPIYGTWNTKARRPQAPPKPIPSATIKSPIATSSSSSLQTLIGEVDEHIYDNHNHQAHHYERLPKRSSTMTPIRRELHDQIPRPPRLTSRQPSLVMRRQFSENDSQRPKPFHFPFDGPLPEEFKKQQQQQQQSERENLAAYDGVQNIQDILNNLHMGGGPMVVSTKVPPLMMMPTGLHISGSYRNLKSSGLANFFRGKRHKKQMQLQFPVPMQMFNGYQASLMGLMPQSYQPRMAMDQIYPFKPKSLNDINLLAMQQQQYQQNLKAQHSKNKKQKKKQKHKNGKSPMANSNLLLPQYPYATIAPEMIYPTLYPPFMAINVTQTPPVLSKRVPFKLNLDIIPVMPPSRTSKPLSTLGMDEARIVPSMRPATALHNPFMEYFSTPLTPTVSALGYYNSPVQRPYNPIRFPGPVQQAQSTNMQWALSDQLQKYIQQQQQQQQQQELNKQQQHHIYANLPNDQGPGNTAANSNNSPIMLHLNVFPKQTSKSISPISTNPFYSNIGDMHRSTIQENGYRNPLNAIEPRHQGKSINDTSQMPISRSDANTNDQEQDLVDFDHPIVAANDISELPTPAALVAAKPNELAYNKKSNITNESSGSNYNPPINSHNNLEQMVTEARTASLFRFPVEDLIQFQVHDAM